MGRSHNVSARRGGGRMSEGQAQKKPPKRSYIYSEIVSCKGTLSHFVCWKGTLEGTSSSTIRASERPLHCVVFSMWASQNVDTI